MGQIVRHGSRLTSSVMAFQSKECALTRCTKQPQGRLGIR